MIGSDYTAAVDLTVDGLPAGATATFAPNPVNPPFPQTSQLTVQNTGGATAGAYKLQITGHDGTNSGVTNADLNVYTAPSAGEVTLLSPPDDATGQPLQPTFAWNSDSSSVQSYTLEVATNTGFTHIVYSATVTDTSHTTAIPLASSTQYHWRVIPQNSCGAGPSSPTFNFMTTALPLAPPVIVVNATSLTSTQATNTIITKTFTIHNSGQETLFWTMDNEVTGPNSLPAIAIPAQEGEEARQEPATPANSLANRRCLPLNTAWVTVSPASGSNIAGATKPVKVTFNATGLGNGIYRGMLCIDSNDPVHNRVLLPLKLTVKNNLKKLYLPILTKS
jgi:hypothetical protein